MLQFKENLATAIRTAIEQAAPGMAPDTTELRGMLEYPPDKAMGDLAFPCFKLSRTLRKAPPMIAATIAEHLGEVPYLKKAEVAGGYLNLFIEDAYFTDKVLNRVLTEGDDYGHRLFLAQRGQALPYRASRHDSHWTFAEKAP